MYPLDHVLDRLDRQLAVPEVDGFLWDPVARKRGLIHGISIRHILRLDEPKLWHGGRGHQGRQLGPREQEGVCARDPGVKVNDKGALVVFVDVNIKHVYVWGELVFGVMCAYTYHPGTCH